MADQGANSVASASTPDKAPPFWDAPLEFLIHSIVGTAIFALIASAAIVIDFAVQRLETLHISPVITYGLMAAAYALFLTDLILFGVFLWKTGVRSAKKL